MNKYIKNKSKHESTMGFPISRKENEKRRAILPEDLFNVKNKEKLYIEENYGEILGIEDKAYESIGCNIVSREEALKQDIICDPKVGDAEYLSELTKNQTIFGWIHAVQNKDITDAIVDNQLTAFAWEDMFEPGRHIFWHNNELAGEAAVLHAFQCYGELPYSKKVAVLGKGNSAKGAIKILTQLGADITIYDSKQENLFKEEISQYDFVVNAILWDVTRDDHIIYKTDLKRMKTNSMIIDVSCDEKGGIETSVSTTAEDPIYVIDSVVHYVVDHTPTLLYKAASKGLSQEISKYIDELIEGKVGNVLKEAHIIDKGSILDQRINVYQKRYN